MEPTPPRRRRRAARRPAGPPGDPVDQPAGPAVDGTSPPNPIPRSPAAPEGQRHEPPPHPVPSPAPLHPTGTPGSGGHPGRPAGERRPGETGARRGRTTGPESSERSLRSLVTTRSTQVPSTAAMRAREVAIPDGADLAAAEAELVIVRRHYVPPTSLPSGRRPDRRSGPTRSGSDREPG